MKKKYFNKKAKRKLKVNLKLHAAQRRRFSKRMGGVTTVSVLEENRNMNAMDLSELTKPVL